MIIRSLEDVKDIEWGNGLSRRLLTEEDGMGYTLTDTVVYKGTSSALQYERHLEACYCIEGSGAVRTVDGEVIPIKQGTMYALDKHDAHHLIASDHEDFRLVCVFSPALRGDEVHTLSEDGYSRY
ncbi:ectoine synthase [Streptomyces sp. NPDC059506]|uniref:L-ectoine synthase n=1 Tax=Streptomyces thermolineatus TaxID=44033 RepID=A0ABN3MQH6_9ACTN|nr:MULTISPECIES: ectoine synthase [unclassified Streptomyces]MCZ2523122.1 ectoine synthase [Streptomyces sp. HB2AG]PLW71849.1 L-ectoine synthase [Streptomyces sp. DJ]QMV23511.1 cupin domain-containing protein [Streptomyces sp. SCUT-3]